MVVYRRTVELMFEKYRTPALFLAKNAVCIHLLPNEFLHYTPFKLKFLDFATELNRDISLVNGLP